MQVKWPNAAVHGDDLQSTAVLDWAIGQGAFAGAAFLGEVILGWRRAVVLAS